MQCLVLAGGLGTRMRPLTESVPKALLPVGGRPFAEYQLEWLASQGVTNIVFSVGHLGDAIERELGDGERWGVRLRYVHERGGLLGTAGAVRLAAHVGVLDDTFFVLYGDAYLRVDLNALQERFCTCALPVLMTVYRNEGRWFASNVRYENGLVVLYDKFAAGQPHMHHIDYGLLAMRRSVIEEKVAPGTAADLAPILTDLSRAGRVAGFEATERFFEIGSQKGIEELDEHIQRMGRETGARS
jgi:MurNAc alpha-1-phosphate uridylyltransferase